MDYLYIRSIGIRWEDIPRYSYLYRIKSIAKMNRLDFIKNVTFFVGENGTGKSTLLEAIAVAYGFNPEGGTKNYAFSTYDSHSALHEAIRIIRSPYKPNHGYFLRAESFYNVATKEEEYVDAWHPSKEYHKKSHGESFLALLQDHFTSQGIYILDEPEAALSPQRQLTLLIEIYRHARAGAQFIIATHSPILLSMPGSTILSFDDGYVHEVKYEETSAYQITEMFVKNREGLLRQLLEEL